MDTNEHIPFARDNLKVDAIWAKALARVDLDVIE